MAAPAGNGIYVVTQYIPNPTFNPAHQLASPYQGPYFLKKFIKGEPKTLGAIQIMNGILQICLGVYLFVTPLSRVLIIVLSGVTFWGSIFYIISGALSVDAEKKGTRSLVKGSLGMNIVSTIFAGIEIIIVSIDLAVDSPISCPYEFCSFRQGFASLLSILLLLLSVLEFCMAFSTSVFGCKSVCCSGNTAETQPELAVQHNYPVHFGNTVGQPAGIPVPYTVSSTPEGPPYNGKGHVQGLPTAPEMIRESTCYVNYPGDGIES
ncbi:membrane-spanning 4-domains subfamily A member 4A-like isoform X1 [Lissotriton helveticus]